MPSSPREWKNVSQQFQMFWNFPHCIGALDGKHVSLQCPIKSGSNYYNYKSFHSIVLFALADAEYNFLFVDVGCEGRISDGGVFKHTKLYEMLTTQSLSLPEDDILPGRTKTVPYVILGDAAFALTNYLMKPFSGTHEKGSPERIFNYRLSRARRVIENVFGISSAVFRVLRKPMLLEPEIAEVIVLAVVNLHNFLRRSKSSRNIYTPPGTFDSDINGQFIPGTWRGEINEVNPSSLISLRTPPRRSPEDAKQIRQEFTEYFMSAEGRVSWQENYA